jgi:hypothetical protein
MANTSTEAGAAPASPPPMSLVSRLVGIITSPKATFEAVAAHPRWFGMLALVTVVVAIFAALPLTTEAGRQAQLDAQVQAMESFGMQISDEMYANMAKGLRNVPYTTFATILIAAPIMSVIISGVLFGVFAIFGGQATFKQLFSVYVHSIAVTAVGQLFTGPLNYFRGAISSATNLAVLLPMIDDHSFIGRLLGMIDLFWIWWLVVLSIGLAVLYKRKTQSVAIGLLGFYAVAVICLAAIMSMFGRSN